MKNDKILTSLSPVKARKFPIKIKTLFFVIETLLIFTLLVVWLSFESIRKSKNLWILFFYNFPSQFLIALVAHEPVFLYFSKFYSPLVVTLVAITGTLLAEILNYSVFKFFSDLIPFKKMKLGKMANYLVKLFNKAPFVALLIAGFTPIPFYPFRFLVVLAHYPLLKYVLAVFLSRTPRFLLIAILGHILNIPDFILAVIFIVLGFFLGIPLISNIIAKNRANKKNTS